MMFINLSEIQKSALYYLSQQEFDERTLFDLIDDNNNFGIMVIAKQLEQLLEYGLIYMDHNSICTVIGITPLALENAQLFN